MLSCDDPCKPLNRLEIKVGWQIQASVKVSLLCEERKASDQFVASYQLMISPDY